MRRQRLSSTTSKPPVDSHVLKFVSRAEQLAWRTRWKKGRWVKLSWTSEERSAILRQDEVYRQADVRWQLNHGPVPGGASILQWRNEHSAGLQAEDSHDETRPLTK
jgi:hypothetical protein